jgi:hypothetical protein
MNYYFNYPLFVRDVDARGGCSAVSLNSNLKLPTLLGWYTQAVTPRYASLGTIAAELGFLPDRYVLHS